MENFNTEINETKTALLDKKGGAILAITLVISIIFFIIGGVYIKGQNEDYSYYQSSLSLGVEHSFYENTDTEYRLDFNSSYNTCVYIYISNGYNTPILRDVNGYAVSLYSNSSSNYYNGTYYEQCYYAYVNTYTSYSLITESDYNTLHIAVTGSNS